MRRSLKTHEARAFMASTARQVLTDVRLGAARRAVEARGSARERRLEAARLDVRSTLHRGAGARAAAYG
jgi:hypothetical protein